MMAWTQLSWMQGLSPLRRAARLTLAVLCSLTALGGCAYVNGIPTRLEKAYASADVGPLNVRGVVLVEAVDGRTVSVVLTVVNNTTAGDRLSALAVAPSPRKVRSAASTAPGGPAPQLTASPNLGVPGPGILRVGGPGDPSIDLADPDKQIVAGSFVHLALSFTKAGTSEMVAMVAPPRGFLAPYAPQGSTPETLHVLLVARNYVVC